MAVRPRSSQAPAVAAPPAAPAAPALIPQGAHAGKEAMPLHRPFILIGSRNRAHVHLVSQTVSRAHAAIINTDNGSYVRDLGSRTHTYVNGRPMKEAPLKHGDALQVGTFQFRYSDKSGRGTIDHAPRAPGAVLQVEGLDEPIAIAARTLLIGQKPVCDVYIADAAVSTAHAIIFELNGRHYLRDLGSRTGTLVNNRPIHQEVLEYGDEIRIGPAMLRFDSPDADVTRLEAPEAQEPEPLAGTGAGVEATTAVTTAATIEEPPLDLTVTEPEPDMLGATAGGTGLEAEAPDLESLAITPEPPALAETTRVVEQEPPEAPIALEAETEPLPPMPEVEDSGPLWPQPLEKAQEKAPEREPVPEPVPDREQPAIVAEPAAEQVSAPAPPTEEAASEAEIFETSVPPAGPPPEPSPAPVAEEPTLPLEDAEPSLADLEAVVGSVAPVSAEETAPAWEAPEPEGSPLDLTSDSFGPLTDMDLLSHLEPSPAEATAPVLDALPDPQAAVAPAPAVTPAPTAAPEEAAEEVPEAAPAAAAEAPAPTPAPTPDTVARPAETVRTYADLGLQFEGEPPPAPPQMVAEEVPEPSGELSATTSPDVTPLPSLADESTTTFVPPPPAAEMPAAQPPVEEPPAAEALTPAAEEPALKETKRRRKGAAPKAPAAPKKKRLWGRKSKEQPAEAQPVEESLAAEQVGPEVVPAAEVPGPVAPESFATTEIAEPAPTAAPAPAPVQTEAVVEETVARTEPTPESALDLPIAEPPAPPADAAAPPEELPAASATAGAPLSQDAAFDRMLDEFAGPSTGPILEEAATPPAAEAPLTFATSEAPPEAPAQPETAVEPPPPSGDQPDEFDLTIEEPARDDAPNLEDLEGIEPPPPAAPAPPPATPAPAPPPARKSAFDPFLGMGRDEGSFIGGMPLQFGPLIPLPRPAPQAPAAAAAPTPPPPSEPKEQAKPAVPEELPPDVPSLADLEGLEPGPHPAGGVSATTGGDAVPPDLELDLSLPDLPDLEAPAAGKAAGTAGRSAEAFDPSALDLPELPPLDLPPLDVTEGGPSPVEAELPPLELPAPPPVSMTTASPVDQPVDPLSFTENEAETLQLLPRPQPPRAGAAGGGPPAAAPPGRESPERESPGGGPPRTTSAPAQPPRAERQRPPASPPRPSRAQAYPATTPPPARGGMPRRQPRGAFDLDLDLGAEFDIPPAAPRPGKGGAGAPARPVPTGGFNGLAMPPVREADVFSPLAFGGGDAIPSTAPPPAGKAGAGQAGASVPPPQPDQAEEDLAAALDLPSSGPGSDLGLGAGLSGPRPGEASAPILGLTGLASAPPAAPGRRGGKPAARSPRDIGHGPPRGGDHGGDRWDAPGPHAAQAPPRRRVGIGLLLAGMIVSLVGAFLGWWYFGPKPEVEVVGMLRFDRLQDLTEGEKRDFEKLQKGTMFNPDFRRQAREILKIADPGMAYGFLGEETDAFTAYEIIVNHAEVKDRTNNFVVYYRGHDRIADKLRMQAVLKALAARNAPAKDAAADAQRKYQDAQDALKAATQEIENQKKQIATMREQGEKMPELEARLKQLEAEDQKLRAAATEARRRVDMLRAELEQAEAPAAPAGPRRGQAEQEPSQASSEDAAPFPQLVAISSAAAPAGPSTRPGVETEADRDPQVRQWKIQLDQLRGAAAAAKAERFGRLERATKSLDEALERFNAEVADASRRLQGESQLKRYVAAGQKMQDALRQASDDLARQQKADRGFLNDMKKRLADKSESRLREAWANDPELRGLEDERAIKERHRNAALGGGLKREAAAVDSEIVDLSKRIETRRDLLGTGRAYAGEVQELGEFIDRTLKRLEDERSRSDKRMGELLAGFAAEAPAAEKLPEDQKKLAAGLEKRSQELAEARRQYAAALASADPSADAGAEKQEQQAAALKAKIATRRSQVAMLVAQEQLTDQQQKTREAKIERLKRDLAAAQQAEAKANAAADASADALGKARRDLAAARESADKIADAQRQQVALERNVEEARARGDELQRKLAKKWRPIDPVEDDVHVNNTGQDPRLWGILYTGAGIIILFSALMWLTSAAGNAPPIAERATYDVLSEGQATGASGTSAGDDDERPLTV